MKKKSLWDRALGLYGRCVLGNILGFFMWVSISIVVFALLPKEQEKITFTANLIAGILTLLLQGFLFGSIVWSNLWTYGDRDGTKDMFKNQKSDPNHGLWVGLIATIPSWIAYFVLIADKLFGFWDKYTLVYRCCNGALYPLIEWTMKKSWQTPLAQIGWPGILLSALPIVITVVIAWVAYYIGYKQIPVMKNLMYKNPAVRK